MEVQHSEIWLNPQFDCCVKYRRTLPPHVKLFGDSDRDSCPVLEAESKLMAQTASGPKSRISLLSGRYQCWQPIYEEVSYIKYDDDQSKPSSQEGMFLNELPGELADDWFGKFPAVEESTSSDLNEPVSSRGKRLIKRPPSPDGEVFNSPRPRALIPHNVIKYQSDHLHWPEPPSLEERLLRLRWAPSPNISFAGSRTKLDEVLGEERLWVDGHFVEGYVDESIDRGEDGEYYRIHKKWLEGHWELAPWVLQRQQNEMIEFEKERLRLLEEQRKYDELLTRTDSPGMDIINWGDGPVQMTKWKENLRTVEDASSWNLLLKQTSALPSESLQKLCAELGEALSEKSETRVAQILEFYFSNKLSTHLIEKLRAEPSGYGSKMLMEFLEQNGEDAAWLMEASSRAELATPSYSVEKQPIEIPESCQVMPDEFRNLLSRFLLQFVKDLPDDPLNYAISYFQNLIPTEISEHSLFPVPRDSSVDYFTRNLPQRRLATCLSGQQPEVPPLEFSYNDIEKTEVEIDSISVTLKDCFLFETLPLASYTDIIRNMYKKNVTAGEVIALDNGADCMYVIQQGTYELSNRTADCYPQTTVMSDRGYFGENCLVDDSVDPRYVTALEDGALWCLHKNDYRYLSVLGNFERRAYIGSMMDKMEVFANLFEEEKDKLIDCTVIRHYTKGEIIFCQQTVPEGVYFIINGAVKLAKIVPLKRGYKKCHSSVIWDPFVIGEANFLSQQLWDTSCVAGTRVVEVAILSPQVFTSLVGEIDDVWKRQLPTALPYHEDHPGEYSPLNRETSEHWAGEQEGEEEEKIKVPEILPLFRPKFSEEERKESDSDEDAKIMQSMMGNIKYEEVVDTGYALMGVGPLKTCDLTKPCDCAHPHGAAPVNVAVESKELNKKLITDKIEGK